LTSKPRASIRCAATWSGFAFSWKQGEGYYLRGPDGGRCSTPRPLEALQPIFEDEAVAKVNQNIKYDLLVLRSQE
jgi:DNA polymerase-1